MQENTVVHCRRIRVVSNAVISQNIFPHRVKKAVTVTTNFTSGGDRGNDRHNTTLRLRQVL